jgi:hypothetical protein
VVYRRGRWFFDTLSRGDNTFVVMYHKMSDAMKPNRIPSQKARSITDILPSRNREVAELSHTDSFKARRP